MVVWDLSYACKDGSMTTTATSMTTLAQVMEKLRSKSWDNEFQYSPKGLYLKDRHYYGPGSLEIIRTYRFEGDSNPSDSSILYVLRTKEGTVGYMVDAYGIYSNREDEAAFNNFIRSIHVSNRDEQILFEL